MKPCLGVGSVPKGAPSSPVDVSSPPAKRGFCTSGVWRTVEDNRGRVSELREQQAAGCNSHTSAQRAEGAGWGAHGSLVAERTRETGVAHPSISLK